MRRPTINALLLVGTLGWTSACAEPKPAALYAPAREVTAADYAEVLATWTRTDEIYQGLNNKLFVHATFHTPEFRRAFAEAWPDVYGHGGQITRRELVELTGDVEAHHNFFVAVYTPESKWNDLQKEDSIWRLTMTGDGDATVGAAEIIAVKVDENLRVIYPYLTRYDKAYLVRFPLADAQGKLLATPETRHLRIKLASAMGVAELDWALVPSAP